MTENQIHMLITLGQHATAGRNVRATDVQLLVSFGPQWKRTAFALERKGYIEANRNGWRITREGLAEIAKDR